MRVHVPVSGDLATVPLSPADIRPFRALILQGYLFQEIIFSFDRRYFRSRVSCLQKDTNPRQFCRQAGLEVILRGEASGAFGAQSA